MSDVLWRMKINFASHHNI